MAHCGAAQGVNAGSQPAAGTTTPVVFVGLATFDAIALVDGLPAADERVVASAVSFAGGGPAATAAVAASRLGVPSAFVGAVGDDEDGRRILLGLSEEGVDISGVRVVPGSSGASVVIVERRGGTRIICTRPVPPLDIAPGSAAADLIRAAQWVHVDHLGWPAVMSLLQPRSPNGRPRLSVDAGNPIPDFSPADVELYVPTVEALVRTYGAREPEELVDAALADGAHTVVATRGGDGSLAATRDGGRHSAPAVRGDIVSTLGAGDVFHGALLAAVVQEMSLDSALTYANTVAALSCAGLDGRSAIPRQTELRRLRRLQSLQRQEDLCRDRQS